MKKIFISASLISILGTAGAQDFHLSQYDVATQYLNPAVTGMYAYEKGDYEDDGNQHYFSVDVIGF